MVPVAGFAGESRRPELESGGWRVVLRRRRTRRRRRKRGKGIRRGEALFGIKNALWREREHYQRGRGEALFAIKNAQ